MRSSMPNRAVMLMTDREMRIAAMAVITFASILETGHPPEADENGVVMAAAYISNEVFEQVFELLDSCDLDALELFEEEKEDD